MPERVNCERCDRWIASYAGGTVQVRWKQLEVYATTPVRVVCRHCGWLNVVDWQEPHQRVSA